MNPRQTYISINLILAGIILLMAVYSGFFSPEKNNYPLSCAYRIKTGKPCPTCGLSRSFSMMMRLRFSEARKYNPFGPRYFSFFALQFLARIALVLLFIIYQNEIT